MSSINIAYLTGDPEGGWKRWKPDLDKVAEIMFENHARTTTYGRPWDETSDAVKAVWLRMAKDAARELERQRNETI
jgi:hypothetical protein